MHPILFHLGDKPIYTYGLFVALGFLAAICTYVWIGQREGRSWDFASDIACWAILGGILGARLAYVVANWDYFAQAPLEIIRIDKGGLIFYGGLFLGTVAIILFAYRKKMSEWDAADYVIPGLAIGHAFGRMGCFLKGCCFGRAATLHPALGVVYPPESDPGILFPGIPLYPVQLLESLALVAIWLILVFLYRRPHRNGAVFASYLVLYPPVRFLLEYLRGDERLAAGHLNTAQLISLGLFTLGLLLFLVLPRRISKKP